MLEEAGASPPYPRPHLLCIRGDDDGMRRQLGHSSHRLCPTAAAPDSYRHRRRLVCALRPLRLIRTSRSGACVGSCRRTAISDLHRFVRVRIPVVGLHLLFPSCCAKVSTLSLCRQYSGSERCSGNSSTFWITRSVPSAKCFSHGFWSCVLGVCWNSSVSTALH